MYNQRVHFTSNIIQAEQQQITQLWTALNKLIPRPTIIAIVAIIMIAVFFIFSTKMKWRPKTKSIELFQPNGYNILAVQYYEYTCTLQEPEN